MSVRTDSSLSSVVASKSPRTAWFFTGSSAMARAIHSRVSGNLPLAARGTRDSGFESASGERPYQMSLGRLWSLASSAWDKSAAARAGRSEGGIR